MPVAPTTGPVNTEPADTAARPVPGPLWRTILTPRWTGLLLLALVIAAGMSVLGVWQLDVYRSKTAVATAQRAAMPPVGLESLFAIDAGLPAKAVGRRVTVTGTWAPAADQIFIADRRHNDQRGFWVVSPVLLDSLANSGADASSEDGTSSEDGAGAVMVVRGWVPSVDDPAAKAPAGDVSLTGAVASSEAQDSSAEAAQGRILSSLRIPTIVGMVDYRVYDAFVVLTSVEQGASTGEGVEAPPVLVQPPSPPKDHAGLRNVAYAFQWWLFAAFTLGMWLRMVLDAHRSPGTDEDPTDRSPDGTTTA